MIFNNGQSPVPTLGPSTSYYHLLPNTYINQKKINLHKRLQSYSTVKICGNNYIFTVLFDMCKYDTYVKI